MVKYILILQNILLSFQILLTVSLIFATYLLTHAMYFRILLQQHITFLLTKFYVTYDRLSYTAATASKTTKY